MANPIILPPLPMVLARVSKAEHDALANQFSSRDLEIARLVLEAAANVCDDDGSNSGYYFAKAIRALEVKHG